MLGSRGLLALSVVSILSLLVGCGGDDVTLSPGDAGAGTDATLDGLQSGDDAADGSAGTDAADDGGGADGADGATSDAGGSDAEAGAPQVTDAASDAPATDAGTDAAATDAGADAAAAAEGGLDSGLLCVQDLSNVHQGDFQISFTLDTTQTGTVALANQRSTCSAGNFWDVLFSSGLGPARITIETDDVTGDAGTPNDAQLKGCTAVDDGASHHVVVQRVAGVLSIFVDGIFNGSTASTTNLVALPPLVTGNDVCVGVDGTAAFDTTKGSLTDVCVATTFTPLAIPDAGACQ